MYFKLLGSLVLLALGVYFLFNGITDLHHIAPPKDTWQKISDFFTNNTMWNPIIEFFGGTPIKETPPPSKFNTSAIVDIAIGTVLVLSGAAFAVYFGRKYQK